MTTGTKSLLFGVHQFLWHPFTVWRAWRYYHKRNPTFWECVAILVHDWGYWGCNRMDDERGQQHPKRGAQILINLFAATHFNTVRNTCRVPYLYKLVAFHSSHLARKEGAEPSRLCAPDKLSILFDAEWWYLLRARLSGEIHEYIANSPMPGAEPQQWYRWYRAKVKEKYEHIT